METTARPHEGRYLVVMGVVGLVAAVFCIPFGAYVWYRANRDLAAMKAGRVDPSGRELAKIARLFGMLGTVIALLTISLVVNGRWLLQMRQI